MFIEKRAECTENLFSFVVPQALVNGLFSIIILSLYCFFTFFIIVFQRMN